MNDVSNRLYLCYAWEDKARIQKLALEIEHELQAKISTGLLETNATEATDEIFSKIADSEIFIVFISDASKKSDYVRACVGRASNLNKNIIPIEIDKQGIFSTRNPDEFKFRSKTYSYTDEVSKAGFIAQLKASLGINVEDGDGFGALVHIVTDREARIKRYGTEIGYAMPDRDNRIRLAKGTHLLQLVDANDPKLSINYTIEIENNDAERVIEIPMQKLLREKQEREERELREKQEREEREQYQREARQRFEREQYELKLRKDAERREEEERQQIEAQRQRMEAARQRAEQERIEQQRLQAQQANDSSSDSDKGGCVESIIGWIVIIVIGIILFSLF